MLRSLLLSVFRLFERHYCASIIYEYNQLNGREWESGRSHRMISEAEQKANKIPLNYTIQCHQALDCVMSVYVCVWALHNTELRNNWKATALNVTHTNILRSLWKALAGMFFRFVCYNGISEHIGETFNQPEMIWKILNEGIYELRFLFAIVLFSVSVIAQHNSSFWCVIISDMEHWISLSDNNKQGPCQHVSLSHTVWCAWVCACVCIWLTAQNLWNNCFDTLHCGQHIVRCRKIIAFVHHEMRLQYSIDDWSGKIASNGDDEWYTRSMTKQIDMQEISQHQFIIEKQ